MVLIHSRILETCRNVRAGSHSVEKAQIERLMLHKNARVQRIISMAFSRLLRRIVRASSDEWWDIGVPLDE